MAYINFQNCTRQEYEQTIYSGDTRNKIKIWFNNVELENADLYCEKLTRKSRILPDDSSKRFSLDNFVSQELTLVLHKIDTSIIQDQVTISIGTLVNNNYEYVPLGIFNIQDTPTTDKDKVTIKLRDNRVKFDFGYNAKPLIDTYGVVSKGQILDDICLKAGVVNSTGNFLGKNDTLAIYDNSITGTTYVSYIAEQAGKIATIDRNGALIFIDLLNLTTQRIPLSIVEKYEVGDKYKVERLVFEEGIIKYETSNDKTLDTLYLNSANPYITNQEQVNNIFSQVQEFEIDSINAGKILGNPAIDPYDIIEIYDDYDENETIIARTLANNTMTYNGNITTQYNTQIGLEERKENVTISGDATYRKYAQAEFDNVNGSLTLMAGQISDQDETIAQIQLDYQSILSKISDIADITTSGESSYATVDLADVNESQPIDIKIHPILENISFLYPCSTLYPSSTTYLKSRTLRFTNKNEYEITEDSYYTNYGKYYSYNVSTDTYTLLIAGTDYTIGNAIVGTIYQNKYYDWVLPTNLWYYDNTIYDDLELSFGDGTNSTVLVNRRCSINSDGTVSVLSTPTTETYDYPEYLVLTDGDYTVSLLGYTTGYLYVQLMAKNIYTTQFYTQVQTNSLIEQTARDITSTVEEIYETKSDATSKNNSLSTRIKQTAKSVELVATDNSTSAGLTIRLKNEDGTEIDSKSANITMTGLVSFTNLSTSNPTTTIINGNNITTGTIKSSNYTSGTSGTSINLSNGAIDSKNFKVSSSGNITATGGTIGGWTISNSALYTSSNNYYLGTTGIIATIGGTSRSNIILKAGSNFGVNSSGVLYANSAVFSNASVQGNISGSSISGGSISGTSISGSSITGGSININDYFSVNTSGGTQLSTSGGGFLTTRTSDHPYVSALNVGKGNGGIVFVTGNSQSSVGSVVGNIYGSSNNSAIVIEGNNGTWIQDVYISGQNISECYQISGLSDTYIRLNYSVVLKPNPSGGAYIWGTEDYNKILTVGGSPSTLSIKTNVEKKNTSDIPNMLKQIELYDYKYIDEINNGENDYGYIIDYLENIEGINKYFVFNEIERNGLKYKTINHEHLSKFLLGAVIELQKEINSLKEEK